METSRAWSVAPWRCGFLFVFYVCLCVQMYQRMRACGVLVRVIAFSAVSLTIYRTGLAALLFPTSDKMLLFFDCHASRWDLALLKCVFGIYSFFQQKREQVLSLCHTLVWDLAMLRRRLLQRPIGSPRSPEPLPRRWWSSRSTPRTSSASWWRRAWRTRRPSRGWPSCDTTGSTAPSWCARPTPASPTGLPPPPQCTVLPATSLCLHRLTEGLHEILGAVRSEVMCWF